LATTIEKIVVEWVDFLRKEKMFGPEDPLFPKGRVAPGPDLQFAALGLDREPWANAHKVRSLFKGAFARVGLLYFNPHSFRTTLVQLAYELKLDADQFKAWSQNLGHEYCPDDVRLLRPIARFPAGRDHARTRQAEADAQP
jgi:hypothetical protein